MKKTIIIGVLTVVVLVIPEITQAAQAFPSVEYSPELNKLEDLVNWTTRMFQYIGATVAGLRATIHFYDMIMGESTDTTKKSLIRIAYGLVGLFFATEGINFLARKFLQIAMS